MPGGAGNPLGIDILDKEFGATDYTPPATHYAALMTAAPTDAGGGTEVAGGGYARIAITNDGSSWDGATGANPPVKLNAATIDFGTAGADWAGSGTPVVVVALYDASSAGNLRGWAVLTTPRVILNGDSIDFPAGSLSFTCA